MKINLEIFPNSEILPNSKPVKIILIKELFNTTSQRYLTLGYWPIYIIDRDHYTLTTTEYRLRFMTNSDIDVLFKNLKSYIEFEVIEEFMYNEEDGTVTINGVYAVELI